MEKEMIKQKAREIAGDANELIERLEALSGPDRNIDAQIHFALRNGIGCGATQDAPQYSASIDAAMTLVPEGCGIRLITPSKNTELEAITGPWPSAAQVHSDKVDCVTGAGATPAIALCIAALRARSADNGQAGDVHAQGEQHD